MPAWIHTLTVDASRNRRAPVTGIGIVVHKRGLNQRRGRRGPVIETHAEGHTDVPVGREEMFAILRALEVARDRGITRLCVRSDCNSTRRRLRAAHRCGPATFSCDLEARILHLARAFEFVDFRYIPGRKNHMADRLAKEGRFLEAGQSRVERPLIDLE